ncbi:MAG: ATP-binding protein [Candidatus Sumerlaeaceae bacterium]|nr:ATP-binding protein [Candidatus Sumerlaeaceae bacterium]
MRRKTANATTVCPKCEGSGFVLTDEGAAPCECQRDTETYRAYRAARIPRKFYMKTLDSFQAKNARQREILMASKEFAKSFRSQASDHPGKGLLLVGKEGTGKTHIAVSILKDVIGRGFTGLYWNVPELFLELRRLMNTSSELTEADIFDEALSIDLLVLDDLGAERSSDYVTERLYVMVNGRYEHDLATIITTNKTLEELRQQLGARIVSRICEMCIPIEFPEGDFRLKNMK